MFNVTSTDEATVNHIATRMSELFAAATSRLEKKDEPRSVTEEPRARSRLHSFFYNPWVIAVGGPLVVAAVIAVLVWLF